MCFCEFFSSFFYILHIFISLQYNTKQYKRGQHKHSSSQICKWVVNDKPFCKTAVSKKMCRPKESRLTCITKHVIRSSPFFRFSFSVISDKNNKGHHSQT